jgi:hypothetical protein
MSCYLQGSGVYSNSTDEVSENLCKLHLLNVMDNGSGTLQAVERRK